MKGSEKKFNLCLQALVVMGDKAWSIYRPKLAFTLIELSQFRGPLGRRSQGIIKKVYRLWTPDTLGSHFWQTVCLGQISATTLSMQRSKQIGIKKQKMTSMKCQGGTPQWVCHLDKISSWRKCNYVRLESVSTGEVDHIGLYIEYISSLHWIRHYVAKH